MRHGADFDVADDDRVLVVGGVRVGASAGLEEVALGFEDLARFPGGDFGGREDFAAGDGVGLRFAGWEEGDVVAEAGRVDDHQVGAGRYFFDPADSVGGLRVAVELRGKRRYWFVPLSFG